MAEMNTPRQAQGARQAQEPGRSAKRMSTRVDLTAMVDLGFLLITFFMLASSFQKPKAMEVNKPVPEDHAAFLKESKTLTILTGKEDKLYCYSGADDDPNLKVDTLNFSRNALRAKILQRRTEVAEKWGDPQALFVSIKLFPKSKFRNMVDLLDEMEICGVKRYAIVDHLNNLDKNIAGRTGN